MSGTFPTTNFTTLNWNSNVTVRETTSITGKVQRSKTGGQYWSFVLQSPPLDRSDFMSIYSFIVSQNGSFESFTVVPPVVASTTGTMTGTVTLTNNAGSTVAVGGSTVKVRSTDTGTLKKGDIIKFSNHDKVYMLTSDTTFDGSSTLDLDIFPPLVNAVSDTHTVTYIDVPVKVFFVENQHSYSVGPDLLYTYEIEVREDI